MSELKVNSIKGTGASTAAITIDSSSGGCSANITNNLSNKNLIINGAMQVAQRETSSTTNGYGSVDRFSIQNTGTDEAPTHAQVDVASGTTPYTLGFRKALRITNGNQTSGAGAGDAVYFTYNGEAQDLASSGWNYTSTSSNITISFWVKSSVAQEFHGFLLSQDGTNMLYSFSLGSLSADTWTKVTKTISGNSNLQFDNDNGLGFLLRITMFRGTDKTGSITQDQWGTFDTNVRYPNFTSTWYTTNDATFEATGLQLEVGSVATDFEHLSEGEDLRRCLRYYFKVGYGVQYVNVAIGIMASSTNFRATVAWPTPMRAAPTLTQSGLDVDSETASAPAITGFQAQHSDRFTGRIQFTCNTASFGAGQAAQAYTGNATSFLAGEAEL